MANEHEYYANVKVGAGAGRLKKEGNETLTEKPLLPEENETMIPETRLRREDVLHGEFKAGQHLTAVQDAAHACRVHGLAGRVHSIKTIKRL